MTRSFEPRAIDDDVLDRVLDAATRAPSAGFTQGTDLIVLRGPTQTSRYWDVTLPTGRRDRFGWPGLLRAPVLVIPVVDPQAYLDRYSEDDKSASGLGESRGRWSVPYWYVDAAFAAMLIMLSAIDEGLGTLFFGIFDHETELMRALGVPEGHHPIGTVAIGHRAPDDRPGRSSARRRRGLEDLVHLGHW